MHGLLWLKDAPKLDEEDPASVAKCAKFVDRFITTDNDETLANTQVHRHTDTCIRKRGKKSAHETQGKRSYKLGRNQQCRFNIPYPPLPRTEILQPLKDCEKDESLHAKLKEIKDSLEAIRDTGANVSTEDFISSTGLNYDEYIKVLRSSIKTTTVFLKRSPNGAFINAYNARIAKCWNANMDIQFITNPYACARYISSYISKSCTAISRLLKEAADELRQGNKSIKDKLWRFGSVFVNGAEVCCQEAAYCVLSMPLTMSSRSSIFIPTNPPEDRVFLLKMPEQLRDLPPDSVDITVPSLLEHYAHRPEEIEHLSLASFSAWYEFSKTRRTSKRTCPNDDVEVTADDDVSGGYIPLLNGGGYIRRRTRAKILRYRRFKFHTNPHEFFREQCMLYVPWRNEEDDINSNNPEALYKNNLEDIEQLRQEFDPDNIYDTLEEAQNEADAEEQQTFINDDDEGAELVDHEFQSFFDCNTESRPWLVEEDDSRSHSYFEPSQLLSDADYTELIRSLNKNQRQYWMHIMRAIRKGTNGLTEYVAGGAGVGKSHLIKAIVQSTCRHHLSKPGADPSLSPVLLCAPTGKAAFLIGGLTNHTAFSLPLNQTQLKPLDPSKRNALHSQLSQLQLVIMDEVSMCSSLHLSFMDKRLQQIFGNPAAFGGINFICFGDLHQVTDLYLRKDTNI